MYMDEIMYFFLKKNMYSLAYFVKLGEHLHTWDFMVKILI